MPATPAAAAVTDAYRAGLLALRADMGRVLRALWTQVHHDRPETIARFLYLAETYMVGAQGLAAAETDAYLARFLSTELSRSIPPIGLGGAGAIDGPHARRRAGEAVARMRTELATGNDAERARQAGLARLLQVAGDDLTAVARDAMDTAMVANARAVRGWRRVASPGACGACLASMDGAVHAPDEPLLGHSRCRCTKEPVAAGIAERVRRPTGAQLFERMTPAEQDALFAGRGGRAKADLLRDGRVALADLVQRTPRANVADWLAETPLADLQRKVAA